MLQINTREFTYRNGTFTACASDLCNMLGYHNKFELVSERTGRVVEMVLVGPRYDREGDLTHWEFQPHACFTFNDLIIFND